MYQKCLQMSEHSHKHTQTQKHAKAKSLFQEFSFDSPRNGTTCRLLKWQTTERQCMECVESRYWFLKFNGRYERNQCVLWLPASMFLYLQIVGIRIRYNVGAEIFVACSHL
jgi:hypothetical protein